MKTIEAEFVDDCLICTSHRRGRGGEGYPEIKRDGRTTSVIRHIWEQKHGPIPEGEILHNTCGDLRCINTEHYETLTRSAFTSTLISRGEDRTNAKLTEDEVRAIKGSSQGYKSLAADYGVSWSTIRNIKKGLRWAHVL